MAEIEIEIIPLDEAEAVLDVVAAAFAEHPLMPADRPGRPRGSAARRMMGCMLDAFAAAPDLHWFGVRSGDDPRRLRCFAMVYTYGYEPPLTKLPGMVWMMTRLLGPRKTLRMMRVMSEKHPGDDRRLELLILATDPHAQARGLGRAMLRHLYGWAAERGYAAVVLESADAPPAFGFYESEGFAVEKELAVPGGTLCYMRRELAETPGSA